MSTSSTTKSENVLGEKWNSCIADTLVKMGGGIAIGAVFSLLFFKRKSWPVVIGFGFGTGMGCSNCQHLFHEPYLVKPERITISAKASILDTAK